MLARQLFRNIRPSQVEVPGNQEAAHHHRGRDPDDPQWQVVHGINYRAVLLERLAEELLNLVAGEIFLEWPAREDRSGREHAERNENDERAFARRLVVAQIVRRAMEGLEDQPPGVERGQPRRDHGQREGIGREDVLAGERRLDDGVLGEIAGGERKAGERERADHHAPVGELNLVAQAAHHADVLLVMHGHDHGAGAEEQKRLEECMRK